MKCLIVYYSRSGHTQKIATELSAELRADLRRINAKGYKGWRGYFKAARHALKQMTVEIDLPDPRVSNYDMTIIGSPVWAGRVAPPVTTFVRDNRQQLGKVAFFCTEGSSGGDKLFAQLEDMTGKTPVATLEITKKDINGGLSNQKITEFLHTIRAQTKNRAETTPGSEAVRTHRSNPKPTMEAMEAVLHLSPESS